MSGRETLKTPGLVLRGYPFGESDLIISFYTREFGKIKGIAKGAKRSKKRFVNVFEPFSLNNFILTRKNRDALAFIDSCDVIEHFAPIRQDLEKTLIASYFIDLADAFSPEGKVNAALFELLTDFLKLLVREKISDAAIRFFEMRLLKITGFEPTLAACVQCKTPVTNGSSYCFYPKEGGIICSACAEPGKYDRDISAGAVRTLLLGKDMEINKITRICLSENLAAESRDITCSFISYVLGREIKSLKVMEQVRRYCP